MNFIDFTLFIMVVILAQANIQITDYMDSRLRGNDEVGAFFYLCVGKENVNQVEMAQTWFLK
jgi:hypothetical protein